MRWHPSGDVLASASYDDTVRLWTADDAAGDDWSCMQTLSGHASTVWDLAFDRLAGTLALALPCAAFRAWVLPFDIEFHK